MKLPAVTRPVAGMNCAAWLGSKELVAALCLRNLWSCIRLNDEYQEYYRQTKETLLTLPKGSLMLVAMVQTIFFGSQAPYPISSERWYDVSMYHNVGEW